MAPFEFDPNRPIYLQIIEEIKKRSVRGVYAPGSKLPSVRDMSQQMGVNPNTMARAYAELERGDFVFTRRGQGSFVSEELARIDAERQALANGAVARFVAEVKELDLSQEQRAGLLHKIEEGLI
jgi:GntR family transcriptional regulator